jgi:hypothetical protein
MTIQSRTVDMGPFNTRGRRIGSFGRDIVRRPASPEPEARSGSVQQREGGVAEISIRAYLCHFLCQTPLMLFADLLDIGRWEAMYNLGNVRAVEKERKKRKE